VIGLRRVNEGIAGRLYHLQGADDLAERLKVENESLKQQLDECRHRYTEPPATPPENHKVTPLDKKRAGGRSNISDEIKQQLTALEVPLNSTLTKTIKSASEEIVLNAIEAFKEAMVTDNIEKPGAWLKAAIEDGWRKNEPLL